MENQYERRKKFIVNIIYFLILLLMGYITVKYAIGYVSPFIFAFLVAYVLKGPSKFISEKLKIPRKPVALLVVLVFYATIGVLLSLLGVKIITVLIDIFSKFPSIYENQLQPFLIESFEGIEKTVYRLDPALVDAINQGFDQVIKSLGNLVTGASVKIVTSVSGVATSLPAFLIKTLLMIISTFFIAGDYDKIQSFFMNQFSPNSSRVFVQIKSFVIETLFVCFRSYALIMSITAVELSIGLSIIGIPNAILIAILIAIFDILPVLGTGGVMIPWGVITLIQGNIALGISLLVLYVVITIIRNIIEPKIVGSQLGLHPIITLMSMFVGVKLIGFIGLFGFPIGLALLMHLNDTGTITIFKKVDNSGVDDIKDLRKK